MALYKCPRQGRVKAFCFCLTGHILAAVAYSYKDIAYQWLSKEWRFNIITVLGIRRHTNHIYPITAGTPVVWGLFLCHTYIMNTVRL
eukprot:scaffold351_cov148-Amphora_coffeaeformis.AAC.9